MKTLWRWLTAAVVLRLSKKRTVHRERGRAACLEEIAPAFFYWAAARIDTFLEILGHLDPPR